MKRWKTIAWIIAAAVMLAGMAACKSTIVEFTLAGTTWKNEAITGYKLYFEFKSGSDGSWTRTDSGGNSTSTPFTYDYDNDDKTGIITYEGRDYTFALSGDKDSLTVDGWIFNGQGVRTFYLDKL
ncbi:hypothetical protein [Breznakiella homolactica]|uniref:Uncharacterized protein n=1 Tax=Breznakiella homolactica TaxID=2798577 RepID=A0A7T7XP02_9SPIR|nr:hypothetical protein [Breznakiella homolactica]QQO09777.1 hypothetical protein JFL75_02375 [Breznakiella homolactica]